MAWIGPLISVVGGAISGGVSNSAKSKAAKKSAAATSAGIKQASDIIQPYSEVGHQALYDLAGLMGMEGYRTKEEQAYTDFMKTAPSKPEMGKPYDASSNYLLGGPQRQVLGDNVAATVSPANLLLPGAGFSLSKDVFGREDKKAAASRNKASLDYKTNMEKYNNDMATWEAKRTELEAAKNKSLENYDPMASLRARPGYQNRYDTGMNTVNNSLASRSGYLGGGALKELTNYGQNFASNEYNNEFNRLSSLAGGGYSAGASLGNLAMTKANNTANLYGLTGQLASDNAQTFNNALQSGISGYYSNQNRQLAGAPSSYEDNGPYSTPPHD